MASYNSRGSIAASPRKADDFRLIKGIGPAIANRLHDAGILTFTHLASLSPGKLAAKVNGLSAKHIARQNWTGQARKLAHKKSQPKSRKKEKELPTLRQHYENFTVEFLLDDKKEARRTRVVHVQSGNEDTWAGWQAEQLNDFLTRHAHVRMPTRKLLSKSNEITSREALQNAKDESGSRIAKVRGSISPPFDEIEVNIVLPATGISKSDFPSQAVSEFAGTLGLYDLEVVTIDSDIPIFALRQGQPYLLRLTLDLRAVFAPRDAPLVYEALVIFKQFDGQDSLVSETGSIWPLSDNATVCLAGISLPQGMYRLHASVRLPSDNISPGITAFLKGDLLQVY